MGQTSYMHIYIRTYIHIQTHTHTFHYITLCYVTYMQNVTSVIAKQTCVCVCE